MQRCLVCLESGGLARKWFDGEPGERATENCKTPTCDAAIPKLKRMRERPPHTMWQLELL